MTVDDSRRAAWIAMHEASGHRPDEPRLPLRGGDGGGTYDGMEPRVAKLEAHMEHVRADLAKLANVPADLAELKAKVAELPTKDWIGSHFRNWIIGGVAVFSLISIILKFIHV